MPASSTVEIPPRPVWMSRREAARPVVIPADEPLPEEVRQRRLLHRFGNTSSGVLVSAAIHLAILLGLNIWFFVTRPRPSGFVINCEILTDDGGAQTPVNALVDAALPDEPPPGGDIRLDVEPGRGSGDGKIARIGAGRPGEGDGAGGGGVGFFGTKAQGNSFVFVVDRSGSMRGDGRLIAAKQELNRAIGTLRENQRFCVLFYNDRMIRMLEPHSPAGLVFALPKTKDDARAWMRPILPDGGTEPAESLRTALEMRPDVVYFLTDGEIPEETEDVVRAANTHGTIIHTTALVSQEGEAILQQIARENGGTYRHIAAVPLSPAELPMAKQELKERAAEAKLRLARKHLQEGHPLTGRRWLEQVIAEFPGTSQAQQAEQLLSAL